MALRTVDQYLAALRDGREVYFRGQRVDDVTQHPVLRVGALHCAVDYRLAEDPEHRDLFTYELPDGQRASRYFKVPTSPQDLVDRNQLIETGTRVSQGVVPLVKEIGTDALFALLIVSREMDRQLGTGYHQRVQQYLDRARREDLALAVAQTDVKGDRSKRPSQQNPDFYVRIVDRNKDGIVIRGAKAHTTNTPFVDEIIVLPTRAMGPDDGDFAVACAVPANAQGLRMIVSPFSPDRESRFHYPVSSRHRLTDTLTIFDNVFVPWERVFLAGEAAFAGAVANTFVEYHRFTAVSYKPPLLDLLIGAAALIADYNGVLNVSHIREKLTRLIIYTESIRAMSRAAAMDPEYTDDGIAVPRTIVTNMCKYYFATQYHQMISLVQDIAGGLLVTGPSEEDLGHPVLGQDIKAYLGGREGVTAEARLKVFNLIRDLTASDFGGYNEVLQIHAEGSIEAQKITIWREYDLQRVVELARQAVETGRP
ncbi:MAG: hypothetical protein LOD91_01950 [Limnochordales bacterium]